MVKNLYEIGFVHLWDCFVVKEEMHMTDELHLSGKGARVFAYGLQRAVDSGLGNAHYLYR